METTVALDTLWVLLGGILVFWMQAGFAMVETGFTRSKNAGNIIMKNLMDFAIGSAVYWILGFGIMFGKDIAGVIGSPIWFASGSISTWDLIFQKMHSCFSKQYFVQQLLL